MIRIKGSSVKIIVTLAVVALFAVSFKCFDSEAINLLCRASLYSARTYIPTNENYNRAKDTAVIQTTEKVAESVAKAEATETMTENKADNSLLKTDKDIADAVKQAEKNAVKDKKDGSIVEYTFTDDGATDSYGCVKVKNTNKTKINIESKLKEKLGLTVNKKEPSVLVYHTHTTETYQLIDRDFYAQGFLSRSSNNNLNMVRVGKAIVEQIEKSGFKVIHDTNIYDKTYSGAYYRSEDAAEAYLKKYPSIKITLDIHRDAIQDDYGVKTKPVAKVNGKKAAQIMIITGCQEEGNGITDLPDWEKNLSFALKLQHNMENSFPGLTRPVFFCDRSYNMGLTPYSLLVEVGSDANTLDEAVYSGKMLGRAVSDLLKDYEEK